MNKIISSAIAVSAITVSTVFGSGLINTLHVYAQSVFEVKIDVNQTVEQILSLISSNEEYQIVVANKTGHTLNLVGTFNWSSSWPVKEVDPSKAQYKDWTENGLGTFSFASNYEVGNTGKYFQFAASWPLARKRKINLCTYNESGNSPAKKCWEEMERNDYVNVVNGNFKARAIPGGDKKKKQWMYEVRSR
jgi:hypothetical protein